MTQAEVQEAIRGFILSDLLQGGAPPNLSHEDDLLELGVIDSMGALEIVGFMERTYGLEVEDEEITLENFRTLANMANLVLAKLGQS